MKAKPKIAVLMGGISAEREVSIGSGQASAKALAANFEVEEFVLTEAALPLALKADEYVAFLTLHGTFGEDGAVQKLMEEAGIAFAGCDSISSSLCMDKVRTKEICKAIGVASLDHVVFQARDDLKAVEVVERLGNEVVIKPSSEGSSVGLSIVSGESEIQSILDGIESGEWMIEPKLTGSEFTVGVLEGKSLEVVEIAPHSGRFDYASKYTKGLTDYHCPARIDNEMRIKLKNMAEMAFAACGCRDFSRIDFMATQEGVPYMLEVNTLPGMTETSLLPMSAKSEGLDFEALVKEMVQPAIERHLSTQEVLNG